MALPKLEARAKRLYTVDEYLKLERATEQRSEYLNGEIFLMAGESGEDGIISANLADEIYLQLKGKDCHLRIKDAKIKTGSFAQTAGKSQTKEMFSYPDLLVVCGGAVEYHDQKKDVIPNPKVIIEVLPDSIRDFDRRDKFVRDRMFNETLTDYVLVARDKPHVEHYVRRDDNSWKTYTYVGLDKICRIESIECGLKLSEIYDRIVFSKKR